MPLLKPPAPKPERVNLQVRIEKSFLERVELYADAGKKHAQALGTTA